MSGFHLWQRAQHDLVKAVLACEVKAVFDEGSADAATASFRVDGEALRVRVS